jgi:two-component system, NarL family, nitrate/nitrite response regulator NarL
MQADTIRILVADDHAMFRDGLKRLVEFEDDLHVVGEAGNAVEAVNLSKRLQPDLLLLDLTMPNGGALDALRAIFSGPPTAMRSIVLTGENHRGDTIAALQLGARGIVLKTSDAELLFRSIRAVMAGEFWLWHRNVADGVEAIRLIMADGDSGAKAVRFRLTPRELEIVPHIAVGASNKDIAATLSVREDTVKRHLSNIFDKLGVYSRLELALFAINHGLVEPPSATATARPLIAAELNQPER